MMQKSELLAAFDAAWDRPWESIMSALEGVSEEEAVFQHPAFSEEVSEAGLPLPGTVLWYVTHLAACYRMYKAAIELRPGAPPEIEQVPSSLSAAIADLKQTRDELRHVIANLSEHELDDELHWGNSIVDLVRGIVRHDAWHGGQIAIVRRLYRMREACEKN